MNKSRILVVDDEKGVVRSCVRILQREGYAVSGKTDSESVPELLRQESFDLLLTDIRMPKIDGLRLLQIAREIDPHLSVVLITGYGTMEDAIKAIRLGAQGFLMKPFEPEDLIGAVQDNLSRRALIQDSLRLQALLPLLEINQMLRPEGRSPGSEMTVLARRVLEIAQRETGAGRIAWLSRQASPFVPLVGAGAAKFVEDGLAELAVAPLPAPLASRLPPEAIAAALERAHPVGVLADGSLVENVEAQPNIVTLVLPLVIQDNVAGVLTAETGDPGRAGPFNQISLDLLSVVAGQLAIVLENARLFRETETLHALNEDIIQNMTNGLIAVDRAQRITVFNPAACAMLGCQNEEVLGHSITAALVGAEELVAVFDSILATGQVCSHQEITIHRRDGTPLPVAVSGAPLVTREANRELVGAVGVLEDLSELKALEAERRRLDRLAALGEMSAVVAHEIRNPIAGIAAGIEYFTRRVPKNSPEYEGVAMIQGEIERINRILEDILFVARPLRLNLAYYEIAPIIEAVIQRCQAQIQAGRVSVATDYADLPLVQVDRQRLEQVLTNLIINATQAMEGGGELRLQTSLSPAVAGETADSIVINVVDTGPGIPAELLRRIFEPFFTTKSKGTGLGLAVARRVVEEHGGTIKAESQELKGTCFCIRLPVSRRAAL